MRTKDRLTQDRLIQELAKKIGGEEAVSLVSLIKDRENVSEFKISEKLNITINQVRNILYKLNEHNLVRFTRKKDKKKGWYIYFWTFDMPKAKTLVMDFKKKEIDELKRRLEQEKNILFYFCPKKCVRVSSDNALELQFKCPECNSVLQQENNEDIITKINEKIRKLTEDLKEVETIELMSTKKEKQRPKAKKKEKKVKARKTKAKKPKVKTRVEITKAKTKEKHKPKPKKQIQIQIQKKPKQPTLKQPTKQPVLQPVNQKASRLNEVKARVRRLFGRK